jgi:hypothetical protein
MQAHRYVFLNINVFYYYYYYFYLLLRHPAAGQHPPHPPRLQIRAGGGHSHSSGPQHPHPTLLARKHEPRVGFPSTTIRPAAHSSQRSPTKAHSTQRRPTKANEGPQDPTQANESQRSPTANDVYYVIILSLTYIDLP